MAWFSGWAKRRKITIDNTNIDSDLTHFPVPVPLGTAVGQSADDVSSIFTELDSSSLKIAITKSDGTTQIYAEVEQWDATAEEALLWVSKSDLTITSASVTELYIYYDSSQGDNTTYIGTPENRTEVWTSDLESRYGFAEDPSSGTDSIKDSTGNNNHLSPQTSMTSGQLINGLIGKAIDLDGSDDWLAGGNTTANFDSPYSVTCLFSLGTTINSDQDDLALFAKEDTSDGFGLLWLYDDGEMRWLTNHGNIQTTKASWAAGTWFVVQGVQRTSSDAEIWADLTSEAQGNNGYSGFDDCKVSLGTRLYDTSIVADITYGEVRYYKTEISDAWRKAEYHSFHDNLLTWGAEEETDEVNTFFMFPF